MRRGVRLALDIGDVRIGVASSDPDGILATPVETVRRGPGDLDRIAALAAELEAVEIVVDCYHEKRAGLPAEPAKADAQ